MLLIKNIFLKDFVFFLIFLHILTFFQYYIKQMDFANAFHLMIAESPILIVASLIVSFFLKKRRLINNKKD